MPIGGLGISVPAVRVSINGRTLPSAAQDDLLAVSVHQDVEALGMFSFELHDWDDRQLRVTWVDDALFREGNEVEIQMGYEERSMATLMIGEITGLEPAFSVSAGATLTVRGYDCRHRFLRGRKTRAFVSMKDSDIVRQIAREAGLVAQVTDTSVPLEYVLQRNQTDLEFLQERARRMGYEVAIEGKTLAFRPPRYDESPGQTLSLDSDLTEFYPRLTTMQQVEEIVVQGWDPKHKTAIIGHGRVGQERSKMGGSTTGPQRVGQVTGGAMASTEVRQPVLSQEEADQIAQGRWHDMALTFIRGEGVCSAGRSDLHAGTVIRIDGAGKRFSGLYYVTTTTHTLSAGQGYRTTFTVKRNAT